MSTNLPSWKITIAPGGRGTRIECDGQHVKNVTHVSVSHGVNEVPRVILTMLAGHIELEGQAERKTQGEKTNG